MKIPAYSLLMLGFVLMALGRPSSDHPNFPAMIIGAVMSLVGAFLLSRLRQGILKPGVTDKDKAQSKETRREFGIRKLLAKGRILTLFLI
jgi:hypothetical protein